MGAISPPPFVDATMMDKVKTRIIEPTLKGLQHRQLDYKGFIFFGLISVDNEPHVIEYNCRLGDPETEVIIPRITSDFVSIIEGIYNGKLSEIEVEISANSAATIMLVSQGYPEKYAKGKEIIIDKSITDSIIFHAGTVLSEYDIVTNGGRVIAVTSYADNHKNAVIKSLKNIERIHFDGMNYRTDIGFDLS